MPRSASSERREGIRLLFPPEIALAEKESRVPYLVAGHRQMQRGRGRSSSSTSGSGGPPTAMAGPGGLANPNVPPTTGFQGLTVYFRLVH